MRVNNIMEHSVMYIFYKIKEFLWNIWNYLVSLFRKIRLPFIPDEHKNLQSESKTISAQTSHEYLVEQVQCNTNDVNPPHQTFTLNFNHPVKELVWTTFVMYINNLKQLWNRMYPDNPNNMFLKNQYLVNDLPRWAHTLSITKNVRAARRIIDPKNIVPHNNCEIRKLGKIMAITQNIRAAKYIQMYGRKISREISYKIDMQY